jgi:hypothetical protein
MHTAHAELGHSHTAHSFGSSFCTSHSPAYRIRSHLINVIMPSQAFEGGKQEIEPRSYKI